MDSPGAYAYSEGLLLAIGADPCVRPAGKTTAHFRRIRTAYQWTDMVFPHGISILLVAGVSPWGRKW